MFTYFRACLITVLICTLASPSFAAVVYVGGQVGGFGAVGVAQTINFALTGGTDAAPAEGDLVIVTYCTFNNTDLTWIIQNSGGTAYTLLGTELYRDDANDINFRSAYRVMPGPTETAVVLSETVTGGNANSATSAYSIQVFRNVHATPLEQVVVQGTHVDTGIPNPGAITPTTTGTVISVVGCGVLAIGAVYTSSDLTSFISHAQTIGGNTDTVVGTGYLAWVSGAFDPAIFGGGGTDGVAHSAAWSVVALAPAAEVASSTHSYTGACVILGIRGC